MGPLPHPQMGVLPALVNEVYLHSPEITNCVN